jgi:spore germination protein KC
VLTILYVLAATTLLSGCSSNLYSNHRDMERLRPIQTFGLDETDGGVTISISSGAGPEDTPPLVMSATASSIETAITRLQDYSPKDELFYAHVEYLLIGDTLADAGIEQLVDWVERSPAMRLDTAAFLVKGRASEAVTGAAGDSADITERLATLEREQLARGQHTYTMREIASSLADRGCALCLAVEALPAQGTVYTQDEGEQLSLIPAGYGVLQAGQLVTYLSQNESLGVQLLLDGAAGAQITVEGVVLEFYQGKAEITGQWDETGTLTGIQVSGTVQAGIVENGQGDTPDIDALENAMTAQVQQYIYDVIAHSQALGCDFLDIEYAILQDAPGHKAALDKDWDNIFPSLPVTVRTEGQIQRSYDLTK